MNHKRLAAGTLALALVCATLASGGFSATEMDRNVDIVIADHGDALVEVSAETDARPKYNENGTKIGIIEETDVTITNQLGHDLTVDRIGGYDIDEELPIHDKKGWTIDGCPEHVTVRVHATPMVFFAAITVDVDGNCEA